MFEKIGELYSTLKAKILFGTPIFLSSIASVAIAWYLLTTFNMLSNEWTLPLIAGTAGLSAVLLPWLIKRFKPLWFIIPTGWTLLLIQMFPSLLTTGTYLLGVIVILAISTELYAYGIQVIHPGELILDGVISIISSILIMKMANPVFTAICLAVTYLLTIIVDFNFDFSYKGQTETDSQTE